MPHRASPTSSTKLASILAGTVAAGFGLWLLGAPSPASAAPLGLGNPTAQAGIVEPVRIYRRGRPPIYPYYYNPGRRGGWSTYLGFVPYQRGNYEVQALQRQYPETNWPPSMRYWNPRDGF